MTYVDTHEGQVHCRIAGDRERGIPVVLFHQTASSSVMFERMMELLADDFFLVAPDTPGFGGTFFLRERASIEAYARVLGEAISRLGITRAHLFGHHTGASIAVELAFRKPALANKIVLSGPPYLSRDEKAHRRASIVPIVVDDDGSHTAALWKRLRAKDASAPTELIHREYVLNMHAGERYHEAYEAVFDHDFEARLASLDADVTVVAGSGDTLRSSLEPAYRALRRGTLAVVEGATTYVCDTHPDAIAALLRRTFQTR